MGLGAGFHRKGCLLGNYSTKMAEHGCAVAEQGLVATMEALQVFRCFLLSDKRLSWSVKAAQKPLCKLSHSCLVSTPGLLGNY